MIRQSHLIAVEGAFLMGCAVLLVGCAGAGSEAPQKEEQGRTDTTKQEQGHTQATKDQFGSEEARCSQTRTFRVEGLHRVVTTNDVPGCPKGGLLSGTDGRDHLDGKDGDDEIHGLGGLDDINGGAGNDVIYGGPGSDYLVDDFGEGVLYGGDGNDALDAIDAWPKDTQSEVDRVGRVLRGPSDTRSASFAGQRRARLPRTCILGHSCIEKPGPDL